MADKKDGEKLPIKSLPPDASGFDKLKFHSGETCKAIIQMTKESLLRSLDFLKNNKISISINLIMIAVIAFVAYQNMQLEKQVIAGQELFEITNDFCDERTLSTIEDNFCRSFSEIQNIDSLSIPVKTITLD
jgi:hypothetical protein